MEREGDPNKKDSSQPCRVAVPTRGQQRAQLAYITQTTPQQHSSGHGEIWAKFQTAALRPDLKRPLKDHLEGPTLTLQTHTTL